MSKENSISMDNISQLFKSLSDPIRLRILLLLLTEGELCVCDLMAVLKLPQSTVSRHLAYLKRRGWLGDRREGVWMHYAISRNLSPLSSGLLDLLGGHAPDDGIVQEDRNSLAEFQARKSHALNDKCS